MGRTRGKAATAGILLGLVMATGTGSPVAGQAPGAGLSDEERARIEAYGETFARAIGASASSRREVVPRVFSRAAVEEHGVDRLAALLERLGADLGAVEFHSAEVAEVDMGSRISRILHVFVRASTDGRWKDLQLRLDPAPPHRVLQLGFIASVTEPVYLPNGAIDDPATLTWLDGYVTRLVREEELSGSILVARGDTPLFERAFGHEDAQGTRPVTRDTRFNLGSGNKMFTALVVARLVEEGRLSFDAPLGRFFPDLLDAGTRRRVTVHHLLSHTSGIADYWTPEYEAAWRELEDPEAMLPFVEAAGVDFEPGTRWAYSNSNFLLAGLMAERVTGEGYFDLVRRLLYEPLGMTGSGSFVDEGSVPGRADPLTRGEGGWARADLPLRGSPAGGGYATARDMLRFVRGLVGGRIVSGEMLDTLLRPRNDGLEGALRYGYGFALHDGGGVASFGHGGTAAGINFELRYFPAEDLTLVLFGNQDNGAFDDLRRNVLRLVTGER